jgi:hypothetical protein
MFYCDRCNESTPHLHAPTNDSRVNEYIDYLKAQIQELQKKLPCGHPTECLVDDMCGKPEHRYCEWCDERDTVESQGKRAMKAETALKEANELNGELAGALRDILEDHDERVAAYPGAPEENPGRVAVMGRGRAILNKIKRPKCPCCGREVGHAHSGHCGKCEAFDLEQKT